MEKQESVDKLAQLQKETRVLEDAVAVLREERQSLQNELDSIRKEVGRCDGRKTVVCFGC